MTQPGSRAFFMEALCCQDFTKIVVAFVVPTPERTAVAPINNQHAEEVDSLSLDSLETPACSTSESLPAS